MPVDYEGWGCMAWNDREQNYTSLWVDNMGDAAMSECEWLDDTTLVMRESRVVQGMPAVQRSISQHTADGVLKSFVTHSLMGAMAPMKTFSATYEQQ